MKGQTVILLHGVAKTKHCFYKLAKQLSTQGYHVINKSYPSFSDPLPVIAQQTIAKLISEVPAENNIHFITHSMGGILLRSYLSQHTVPNLGRVVMLAPPNKGSALIDIAKKLLGKQRFSQQAIMQLGTQQDDLTQRLGRADFELGIIAGKRSVNPVLSLFLPGRDDGKVSVENTKLLGMKAHLVLPVTHPFMMKNSKVIKQALCFLETGCFNPIGN